MGVIHFEKDISAGVDPSRMFKAFVLDSHNLFPQLLPQAFSSIVYEQGDAQTAGSIRTMHFAEGDKQAYAKQRVDAVDRDRFHCKYTVFEGCISDMLESIVYEIKLEASGDGGGSICKTCTEFHVKGEDPVEMSKMEEEFKGCVEEGASLFKTVEAHLLANPHLYA